MANLRANTGVAKANSKGFVTDKVVTNNVIKEYEKYDCRFCLRLIYPEKDNNAVEATGAEVYSIMANSNENGQGLAFMPLVKATTLADTGNVLEKITAKLVKGETQSGNEVETGDKTEGKTEVTDPREKILGYAKSGGVKDAKKVLARIEELGLPINMTVWLDEKSVEVVCATVAATEEAKSITPPITAADLRSTYRSAWAAEMTKAGYSAGYYYGGVESSSCSCESSDPSNSVLSAVDCGTMSASYRFKIITIGDNNNEACQIRWAYMGASS